MKTSTCVLLQWGLRMTKTTGSLKAIRPDVTVMRKPRWLVEGPVARHPAPRWGRWRGVLGQGPHAGDRHPLAWHGSHQAAILARPGGRCRTVFGRRRSAAGDDPA